METCFLRGLAYITTFTLLSSEIMPGTNHVRMIQNCY
jgi:hypothetical protein